MYTIYKQLASIIRPSASVSLTAITGKTANPIERLDGTIYDLLCSSSRQERKQFPNFGRRRLVTVFANLERFCIVDLCCLRFAVPAIQSGATAVGRAGGSELDNLPRIARPVGI